MALNDADLFLVNQGGESKKITYSNLKLNINADEALWELDGDNIQPKDDAHNVEIGGGNIALNENGTAEFSSFVYAEDFSNSEGCELGRVLNVRRNSSSQAIAVYNGGTTVNDIKARINGDGSAQFAGTVQVGGARQVDAVGASLESFGGVRAARPSTQVNPDIASVFEGWLGTNATSNIFADGSATFTGNVTVGTLGAFNQFRADGFHESYMKTASGNIQEWRSNANGTNTQCASLSASGVLGFSNLKINTDAGLPGNYNAEGEYTGPTLDVKDRLMNLISRLDAIEANEVIDDATDTSLLQLVANASARLDSIEARLTALEGGN